MKTLIQPIDYAGQAQHLTVEGRPDYCPICHHGIEPKDLKRDYLIERPMSVQRVFPSVMHVANVAGHVDPSAEPVLIEALPSGIEVEQPGEFAVRISNEDPLVGLFLESYSM
jgi:hypothetical protein